MGDGTSHRQIADRLAVEEQVLTLCLERRTLVRQIYEQDRAIARLRQPETDADPTAISSRDPEPVDTGRSAPSGLLAPASGTFTQAGAIRTPAPAPSALQTTATARPTSLVQTGSARSDPPLTWFTITGTGEALVAGISDGRKRWFVASGMSLPGGVTVLDVTARPPGVRVRVGGSTYPLAYRTTDEGRP